MGAIGKKRAERPRCDIIRRMPESARPPGLVRSTSAAVILFVVTGLVAAITIRDVVFHPMRQHSRWLFPIFFHVPHWIFISVQLAFYGCLLGLCFEFFREANARERLIVLAWFFNIFAGPLDTFISQSTARVMDHVQLLAMFTASLVALDILLKRFIPRTGEPQV